MQLRWGLASGAGAVSAPALPAAPRVDQKLQQGSGLALAAGPGKRWADLPGQGPNSTRIDRRLVSGLATATRRYRCTPADLL
jgi:hypothetical protein